MKLSIGLLIQVGIFKEKKMNYSNNIMQII